MRQIAAIIALSLMLSGCLYSTPYGLLTVGQLAEVEHTRGEAIYNKDAGDCRVKNVRAIKGNGVLEIGLAPDLHIRGVKDNEATQRCEIIELTCPDCSFVPLAGVNVKDYKIEKIDYYTGNLLFKLLVMPRQVKYLESALRTLKAQQNSE